MSRGRRAAVDEAGGRVRFPRPLLRELLASVPVELRPSRSAGGDRNRWSAGSEQYAHAIVTDPWIVDYETQKPRRPRLDDLRRHTVIAQKLDPMVGISLMDFPVTDVPEPISSLRAFEEHVLGHDKHIYVYATEQERYEDWLNVLRILGGTDDLTQGRLASVAVGVLSPLAVSGLNVEFLLSACANNLPVIPTICPIAGMTSPYSMASTLLQSNVETIGLAALTQVVRRGHPYQYGMGPSIGHMRSHARHVLHPGQGVVVVGRGAVGQVVQHAGRRRMRWFDDLPLRSAERCGGDALHAGRAGQFGRRPDRQVSAQPTTPSACRPR